MPTLTEQLLEQNPWWNNDLPEHGITRQKYLDKIEKYLNLGEIIVLNGVRRSGKTTLLKQTIHYLIQTKNKPNQSILYLNCDEPWLMEITNPLETLLETYRTNIYSGDDVTLVLDEIQTIPEWEKWIKAWYDRKKYRIIISGSSSSLLNSGLAEKISGRYLPIQVYPLDYPEYLQLHNISVKNDIIHLSAGKYEFQNKLREYMSEGGFPGLINITDKRSKQDTLMAYYDSIIFRDINSSHDIRNPSALTALLQYMMTNISAPFSYRKLARQFGVEPVSVQDYLSYAKEAFLLFEVKYFSYSVKVQNTNNKKIYSIDTGLRNAVSFKFSADEGRLAENLVFLELLRKGFTPYYWKGKHEVDFVVKHRDESISAVNVCYSDELPEREIIGLQEFSDTFQNTIFSKLVITKDTEMEKDGILFVPLWKWLLTGSIIV